MRQMILALALLAAGCQSGGGNAPVTDQSQTSMTAGQDRAEYFSGETVMEDQTPERTAMEERPSDELDEPGA